MKTLHQHIAEKLIINKAYKAPIFELNDYIDNKFFIEIFITNVNNLTFRIISKDKFIKRSYNIASIEGTIIAGKEISKPKDMKYTRTFYFDETTGLFYYRLSTTTYEGYRILFPITHVYETMLDNLRQDKLLTFEDLDNIFNIHLTSLITRNYGNNKKNLRFKIKSTDQNINAIKSVIKYNQYEI